MTPFDYHAPKTLRSAMRLVQAFGDDAKVLAGGHSLIPSMKLRLAAPSVVIDLGWHCWLKKSDSGQ